MPVKCYFREKHRESQKLLFSDADDETVAGRIVNFTQQRNYSLTYAHAYGTLSQKRLTLAQSS